MEKSDISSVLEVLNGKSANEIIKWIFDTIGVENVALASSLGIEDQVLTDLVLKQNDKARIFTLDTGRLPQETYSAMDKTMMHYNFKYEVLFPDRDKVEKMVSEYGANLFYESIEKRKLCCDVRKVDILKKKLSTLKAWICGLRKEQSVTRTNINVVEWDEANNLLKFNPLIDWNEADVWNYLKKENVPYNKLFDKGYTSIGCAPCTRAIEKGEDLRAGRWWWEDPMHKECGLHVKK
ncbi:MAG: phosphoadenylyl-sulfate reductase [Bacteroidales bacterium]|nr:phosphoadenylyl-sulfate reductase [Bacteroidales bacterium]